MSEQYGAVQIHMDVRDFRRVELRAAVLARIDDPVENALDPQAFANELERHFVECDRRGAALADAQAEIARLRAAVDVHALAEEIHDAIVGAGGDCPDVDDGNDSLCERIAERVVRALAAAPALAEDGPGYTGECFGDCEVCTAAPAPAEDECPPICGELGSLHGPGHPCVLPPGHELHRDGVGGEWTHPPAHWGPAPRPAAPALAEDEEA